MSDVAVPGSGKTFATKTVSGVEIPLTQIDGGTPSTRVPIVAGQKPMATSLPVVLPSDQIVDVRQAALGFATDSVAVGAALPAGTNNIGDVDVLTLPALPDGTNSIGGAKDNGPHWTPVRTYTESADMTTAVAITAAPTSGQKIYADDILVSSDTAMNFKIQMETTSNVLAKVFIPANGTVQITLRDGIKGDAADKKLFGKASVSGNVAITACYHSEA